MKTSVIICAMGAAVAASQAMCGIPSGVRWMWTGPQDSPKPAALPAGTGAQPQDQAKEQPAAQPVDQQERKKPSPQDVLTNPGSYIVVHKAEAPAPAGAESAGSVREESNVVATPLGPGMIEVPSNARAGDPAFADADQDEEQVDYIIVDDGSGGPYGPYGVRHVWRVKGFHRDPDRQHGRRHRGYDWQGWDSLPIGAGMAATEAGRATADDLNRRAQLQFADAAQPHLAEQDAAWRRAQLQFHEATQTPGVQRAPDGLRHESSPPAGGPGRPGGHR